MAAALRLRDDFDAARLRRLAKAAPDPDQLRRLLSLAEIYDGGSRGDAARIGSLGCRRFAIGCLASTNAALMRVGPEPSS